MSDSNNALSVEKKLESCYETDINWSDYPKRLEKVTPNEIFHI